jgi:hypothetical protein
LPSPPALQPPTSGLLAMSGPSGGTHHVLRPPVEPSLQHIRHPSLWETANDATIYTSDDVLGTALAATVWSTAILDAAPNALRRDRHWLRMPGHRWAPFRARAAAQAMEAAWGLLHDMAARASQFNDLRNCITQQLDRATAALRQRLPTLERRGIIDADVIFVQLWARHSWLLAMMELAINGEILHGTDRLYALLDQSQEMHNRARQYLLHEETVDDALTGLWGTMHDLDFSKRIDDDVNNWFTTFAAMAWFMQLFVWYTQACATLPQAPEPQMPAYMTESAWLAELAFNAWADEPDNPPIPTTLPTTSTGDCHWCDLPCHTYCVTCTRWVCHHHDCDCHGTPTTGHWTETRTIIQTDLAICLELAQAGPIWRPATRANRRWAFYMNRLHQRDRNYLRLASSLLTTMELVMIQGQGSIRTRMSDSAINLATRVLPYIQNLLIDHASTRDGFPEMVTAQPHLPGLL